MLVFTSLLAFVAFVAAQADPSINTPAAVVQCQPAQISFTATRTPVFISIIPGGQPSATPLQDLGQQSASPFTWVASIAAGTQITFQIRDSTGAVAYSAPVTVQESSDSSCIGQNPSGSSSQTATAPGTSSSAPASSPVSSPSSPAPSSSVAASTSSAAPTVTTPTTSPVSTRPTSSGSSTRAASATSASPSASVSPNAARSNAKVGLAGLLGLAAAVVMA